MSADGAAPVDGPFSGDREAERVTRRQQLLDLLDAAATNGHAGAGVRARLDRVCAVAPSEIGVDGAGVTVMGSREGARDQLAATGDLTRRLEELQLTIGEGPCLDAYAAGVPVLVADLAAERTHWTAFGREALTAGAAALFSLPLQVGAVRLGTLDLYRRSAGGLSRAQLADALILADFGAEILLGHPEPDSEPATDPRVDPGWLPDVHGEVHIASGMVSVQSDMDVGAALLRVRAYAFARGEPLHDVARRIIDHTLVLDRNDERPDELPDDNDDDDNGGPTARDAESDDR